MADIVLTTLNARHIHAAFGLRYLMANLGPLQSRALLLEFDINQRPLDVAEVLLRHNPKIIGLGVYIWNAAPAAQLVAALKQVRPETILILGGPEVSYETNGQPIVELADYTITGEADVKFAELCGQLLNGDSPGSKIIPAELPELSRLTLPYDLYDEHDIAHRIIYIEASRGCPFTCEFCLSSLEVPVRQFPVPSLLDQLERLLARGVRQFKFVDRTFNLNPTVSRSILEFLLERYRPGHFFHFEMIPDRLPETLRQVIAAFPPGALQFEVGIQSFNEEVAVRIKRRQNYPRLAETLEFLRTRTGVHIHADLIAGLPGESLESFGAGFDRLVALGPQEIQVGILKRLRGTPIVRHDEEWQMSYNPHPPYEVLQNKLINFVEMQALRRFARYWDLIANSGNFVQTTPLIWSQPAIADAVSLLPGQTQLPGSGNHPDPVQGPAISPFRSFWRLSQWLYGRVNRTNSIALLQLMELLFEYLTSELNLERPYVAKTLWADYQRGGRIDKPGFLKDYLQAEPRISMTLRTDRPLPKRQARHLAG